MEKTHKLLVHEALGRGVDKVYPSSEALESALLSARKLKIYLGADPTGAHLHLGHATNLLVLRRFQELGHKIVFLIGDFTARIGDPSGKTTARVPLTGAQVKENFKTFKSQVSRVLNFKGKNPVEVKFNSKWLSRMSFADVARIASHFTVQQMIKRDMFQERLKEDKPIGLHEFLYPLMQGYDSVAMDVDMEIGGTDQTFNMLAGRDLVKALKGKDKFVLTTKLLVNPKTGKKLMNKSEGGLINLDDAPGDMFGKVMSLEDSVMFDVAELSTIMPQSEIEDLKHAVLKLKMNPRDAKARIAHWVVSTFYGEKEADAAGREFDRVFRTRELPTDMPTVKVGKNEIDVIDLLLLTKLASSKGEARRLIAQGGVRFDDRKLIATEVLKISKKGNVLQVGKRHFVRIIGYL